MRKVISGLSVAPLPSHELSNFFQEHGGQPDMGWVDQLNENKTMVILNNESKTFTSNNLNLTQL